MPKLKPELQRIEETDDIQKVEQPTAWCAGIIDVPPKFNASLQFCVNLTEFNDTVWRETHIL